MKPQTLKARIEHLQRRHVRHEDVLELLGEDEAPRPNTRGPRLTVRLTGWRRNPDTGEWEEQPDE